MVNSTDFAGFAKPQKRKINAGDDSAKSIFFGVDGVGEGRGSKVYLRVNKSGEPGIAVIARNRRNRT